jgi:uncharacterized protein
VNRRGTLIDTGPLVALLHRTDSHHARARRLAATCEAPFRTCEAVLAEAAQLLAKVDPAGPAGLLALGRRGAFEIALHLDEHWLAIERTLTKYRDVPVSLAGACLIRCAELLDEPRIATFDSDFRIYRWGRNKPFEILD